MKLLRQFRAAQTLLRPSPRAMARKGATHEAAHGPPGWLQWSSGNRAVGRLLDAGFSAPQFRVSGSGDEHEQEADQVAEAMVTTSAPLSVQRACACEGGPPCPKCADEEEEGVVQRKTQPMASAASPTTDSRSVRNLGAGHPLDTASRSFFESWFGHEFSQVRIHTDAHAAESARALNALAYTVGRDIVMAEGKYAPGTTEGRRLLAHELTHVVQQRDANRPAGFARLGVDPSGSDAEREARGAEQGIGDGPMQGQSAIRPSIRLAVPVISRAETDDDPKYCFPPGGTPLIDSQSTINEWIASGQHAAQKDGLHATAGVFKELAEGGSVTPVEKRLGALSPKQVFHLDYGKSRYAGTLMWPVDPLTRAGLALAGKVFVAPVINLCGVCLGTDKVGHFFQQGYEYFRLGQRLRARIENLNHEEQKQMFARLSGPPAPSPLGGEPLQLELSEYADSIVSAFTVEFGKWLEGFHHRLSDEDIKWIKSQDFIKWYYSEGVYGSATTGVLSRADLQANRQGFLFYTDMWNDPARSPDICSYVGELWNERKELNTYVPGLGAPSGPRSYSMEAEKP